MKSSTRRLCRYILLTTLLVTATRATGDGWINPFDKLDWELPESVQIHGFASQAYLHTSANNFFGYSQNMGSLDFTEIGINGSWRPLPQLQTSMQVVYRRAGRSDDSLVRIDFGFLDYALLSDAKSLLGVRVGRVVNPYGFYNDTRDMPFTRPSILLPQSIYFDINRQFALSGDGFQLYGEHRSDYGSFFLQFNAQYSRANDPAWKEVVFGGFGPGSTYGQPSWVGRLMYEWQEGRLRLGVTSADQNVAYDPRAGTPNGKDPVLTFSPILFSAQYNAEDWSFTSEYAIRPSTFTNFGAPTFRSTGESYYVQGTYRLTPEVESFLRYDVLYGDVSDRNGEKYAAATGRPAYDSFAKDLAVGLRWDVTPSVMLRAEYHYIEGTGWTLPSENAGETSKYWNMFAAQVSFRF